MANKQMGNVHGVTAVRGSAAEVQTIRGGATAGNFALIFSGLETAAIPFNETAANIQTALRNLANISATGVVCAGGPLNTTPVTVSFQNEYLGVDVPRLAMRNINLTGGTVTVEDTTAPTEYFDADALSIPAMRARLTAISGTTYTSTVLDKMTENDMLFALRQLDAPGSVV